MPLYKILLVKYCDYKYTKKKILNNVDNIKQYNILFYDA